MTVLDPVLDPLVALLAALATGAQLAILVSLHRQDGEPFVAWSIVAWGARFAYFLIPLARLAVDVDPRLWPPLAAASSGASSLAFLAAGLAYRTRARPDRRLVVGGAVLVLALGALAHGSRGALETAGLPLAGVEALALFGAGAAFWPGEARRVPGASLLAGGLLLWGAVRVALDLPLAQRAQLALLPLATVVLVVQMTALVIVVLRGAQQRVEFLKAFNDRLIDGIDHGAARPRRERRHDDPHAGLEGPARPTSSCIPRHPSCRAARGIARMPVPWKGGGNRPPTVPVRYPPRVGAAAARRRAGGRGAVRQAGILEPATCYAFSPSFATHLLEDDHAII